MKLSASVMRREGKEPSSAVPTIFAKLLEITDARRRERYLISGRGGRYLEQRPASWLAKFGAKLERHQPRVGRDSGPAFQRFEPSSGHTFNTVYRSPRFLRGGIRQNRA